MKDVLNSLGGMELLFPILENVRVPLKQLPVDNEESDNDEEANGLISIFNGMYMYMYMWRVHCILNMYVYHVGYVHVYVHVEGILSMYVYHVGYVHIYVHVEGILSMYVYHVGYVHVYVHVEGILSMYVYHVGYMYMWKVY